MYRVPLFILLSFFITTNIFADNDNPSVSITFDAVSSDEQTVEKQSTFEGSAPIEVTFNMELFDSDGWTYEYEWRFCHEGGNLDEPYMIRYEESPVVTFTQAGTDSIALYITFTRGEEVRKMTRMYWSENTPLTIKASESNLVFPNAFSPNGDGDNDTYMPKTFQSIVEFKAIIYNRWGQKMFEWEDVSSMGWNGKFHGSDVKQGTYFVFVRARGADGRQFTIKKDVNLLRDYNIYDTGTSSASSSTTTP